VCPAVVWWLGANGLHGRQRGSAKVTAAPHPPTLERSTVETLLLLAVLLGVMYLLLVRPRQKQMARHRELLASLGPGDRVVTIGGVHGVIAAIEDDVVVVAVAPGVEIAFSREAISRSVVDEAGTEPDDEAPEGESAGDDTAGGGGSGGPTGDDT